MGGSGRLAVATGSMLAVTVPATAIDPTFRFEDVSGDRGIQPYVMANGKGASVVAADFDDDGDVDVFLPTAAGVPHQLYRNLGNGHFEEIAAAAGLASLDAGKVALWFDYDGDRRLDLFVAADCWNADQSCPSTSTLRLYRQAADAVFVDVTQAAEIPNDHIESTTPHRGGACAGDINGDGYLDLIVGLWFGDVQVLLNDGDGTFTDIGASSGIGGEFGHHWQPVMHDFDGNGYPDVYHAVDFNVNHLWVNQRDRTFLDKGGESGTNNAMNDMGVALGDIDNDGDLDIYITNIKNSARHNVLYRNDSVGEALHFTDVSLDVGVDAGGWGWGCALFDADNDGDLDIAATNGWFDGPHHDDPSVFFMNTSEETLAFETVSAAVGFDDTYFGSSLLAVDFDRDGDLDLAQTCNGNGTQPHLFRLLDNQPAIPGAQNDHLVIRPRMTGPNHRAIGAIVRVTAGDLEMMRLIGAGTSFFGQEPAEAFFGLGSADAVERVVIEWPDGRRTELADVDANQVLTVYPMTFTDVTAETGVGLPGTLTESVAWGDYDNDGDADLYLTNDGANTLFRNDGGETFTDVTFVTRVGDDGWGVGTAFGDLDNDGDLDLYVVNFGIGPDVLYRNDGPTGPDGEYQFTNVAAGAGITLDRSSRGMAFLDYDRDGRLDIYVNAIGDDILYHNLGDLEFEDVAGELGTNPSGQGVGVVGTDVDRNGWIDIYNGNRSGDLSNLFINEGGTFTDVAADAGIGAFGLGMGILSFDYDNDLDMDLYWTTWPGTGKTPVPNAFYQNQGDGLSFVEVAGATGTLDPDGWGISCNAGDVDNDRLMDFFVTNGFSSDSTANVLFRNRDTAVFDDMTAVLGGADWDGRGVAFADYDGDGDLDVILTGGETAVNRLWRNDTLNGNHWATIKLIGRTSNRSGIGAWIEVTAGGVRTVQEVSSGAGRGSFNSIPVEFGLGREASIETVYIRWPSGVPQLVTDVGVDEVTTITEPIPGDLNGDEVVDFADILLVLMQWGPCPGGSDYCLADLDSSGVVDFADVLIVLINWT